MSEESRTVTSKERSPNYPAMGLSAAIELARRLWGAAKRASVSPETAAQIIGYNSLSGPARSAIAALRQYGLLAAGQGSVALSDLAIDILVHGEETQEWREAIRAAGQAPAIFAEISTTYPGASDSVVRTYLISKRRFSEEGATRLLKAYRETASLVNRAAEGYDKADQNGERASGDDMQTSQQTQQAQSVSGQHVTSHIVPLAGGMRLEIRFVGREVRPEDISAAEKYLKFQKEMLNPGIDNG